MRDQWGSWLLFVIEFIRLIFEIILTISVFGLVVVASAFLVLIAINLADFIGGTGWRGKPVHIDLPDEDLPHVLVQIPVFNESNVVTGALQVAAALDWPQTKLHIQLLDDSDDDTTAVAASVVAELREKGFDVQHLFRTDRTGFKAGALAAGLLVSDAPFIAMLDVDFRPPSDWLRKIVPLMLADSKAGFVQSRCEFSNYKTNWLTRAQGMLLDSHFAMEQAARYRAGWLFQFNGTGGLWRRAAVDAAGGWSADSLCEDLDLTIRAGLAGWHGVFLMEPPIPGLVPERVRHWRVQQRRWSNGFVQVAHKLMGPIWASGDWTFGRKLSATFLILVQAFYPCVAIATVAMVMCILLRGLNPAVYFPVIGFLVVLILLVAIGLTLMPYVVLRRGSLKDYAATAALLTPLMIYLSVSNTPKILQTAFGRREQFKRTPKSTPSGN
jgi:cellulose synthase/poly-beta-1,6-N-acetylglucosamine synthase-like glycosyltransferase